MQIKIYTELPRELSATILDNDSYFFEKITASLFNQDALDVIKNIDKAEVLDFKIGTIQTPYGITSIENLSTGCKAILNYMFADTSIEYIDATCCGYNALNELFRIIRLDKYRPIKIILTHCDDTFNCVEGDYLINDKTIITNLIELSNWNLTSRRYK